MGEAESEVARTLVDGNAPAIADAVMKMDAVREELFKSFLKLINIECSELCQKRQSPFRKIPVDKIPQFQWEHFIEDLELKSPLLLRVLITAVTRIDYRYQHIPETAKFPGIVSAAALLLKQRNREMCGMASVVSLLMYACHCEKKV